MSRSLPITIILRCGMREGVRWQMSRCPRRRRDVTIAIIVIIPIIVIIITITIIVCRMREGVSWQVSPQAERCLSALHGLQQQQQSRPEIPKFNWKSGEKCLFAKTHSACQMERCLSALHSLQLQLHTKIFNDSEH